MTEAMRDHLVGLGEKGRERLRRDSVEALRGAWADRDVRRARIVVRANVVMLRNLRNVAREEER